MDKYITMSKKEINKSDIIKKVIKKELKEKEAAGLLSLSVRQIRRLRKRVKEKGIKGLIHAGRGRNSNRKIPISEKEQIIEILHKNYSDFGPTFAAEKLAEVHNIRRDTKTIRAIMISEGLWRPKQKKKEKHHSWRQRKASKGEMIQYDGSYEHWLEDRGKKCCLLACIDDATNRVWLKFDKHEGVHPTFSFWREYIERFGKPYSIYVDRFSTYSMNHKLAKENDDTLTQFQRAMGIDLNIEIILAKSAEAKGRVEVLFKTLQDRLIKEFRLAGINTIEEANIFLENVYLDKHNFKFMVEPRVKANLHKKLNKKEKNKLDGVFSKQYERTVRNDFTISYKNKYYQLTSNQPVTICKKDRITVEERMDNTIYLRLRGKYLNYEVLPDKPKKINNKTWVIAKSKAHKPAPNHPWRQYQNIKVFNN
jgi:hypothetical protein